MQDDIRLIRDGLQQRVVDVCRNLLPTGQAQGKHWVSHDPVTGDYDRTPQLKVLISGERTGAWRAFRGGDEGAKHDLLGLVMYVQRTDAKGAILWARDFLGLRAMTREERASMARQAEQRQARRQKDDEAKRAEKLRQAHRLWATGCGGPATAGGHGAGCDALAIAYFAGRAIPLDEVPNISGHAFRFAAAVEWWKGAVWKPGGQGGHYKATPGPTFPAVLTAARAPGGQIAACHCTFLDPLRPAKAPVDPAKLVYGLQGGTVMEVAEGPAAAPFWLTERSEPVIIAEGIETALSLAIAIPEARVWAAGSITNLGNAPVHLPCVSQIFLARDTNAGNRTAQQQLDQSLEKLEAAGKPIVVMESIVGDDFNDLMKGE